MAPTERDEMQLWTRRLAWVAFSLVTLSFLSGLVLSVLNATGPHASERRQIVAEALLSVAMLSFPVVGVLIATRQPRNAIGWILLAIGLVMELPLEPYVRYAVVTDPRSLPRPDLVAVLTSGFWVPSFGLIGTFLLLLFPDGHLPSPRWRPLAWLSALVLIVLTVVIPLMPGSLPEVAQTPFLPRVPNPLGIEALRPVLGGLYAVLALLPLCMVGCALSLIVRFRRSQGRERLQIKWLAAGAGLAATLYLLTMAFSLPYQMDWSGSTTPGWLAVLQNVSTYAFVLIPVAIGIAILKYRLYDIDVVINKTVVFGALAAFITLIYVAIVVGIGNALGQGEEPNLALSIAATAIVAVAFQPVRERVQRFANRLVYGHRATPYEVMAGFSQSLAGVLDVDEVLPRTAQAAATAVGATASRATLYLDHDDARSATWPDDATPGAFDHTVPVSYKAERLGELAITKPRAEPVTPADARLLNDLAAQAGIALHNAQLALELRARLDDISAQAAELTESRHRIVSAADQSKRELERDISTGPERRLKAMADKLAAVEDTMTHDPERAAAVLNELAQDANHTLDELRELARGIFPPLLADKGVVAAIEAQARKTSIPVTIDADAELADKRFAEEVETAAYFCCVEALRQFAERAPNGSATIRLTTSDAELCFEVATNADTSAPGRERLRNMADRVEALGGTLHVTKRPDDGAAITGRIPTPALASVD